MPNALNMLKSDHTRIKKILRDLNATTSRGVKTRRDLVEQLEREVKTHAQIEEEVFYPAYKAAAGKSEKVSLFYEAAEEHHIVDMEMPTLKTSNPASPEFEAKAKVLKELLEHHMKDEEGEMFAAARTLFTESQLVEIGDLMESRRETIEAMWSNPLLRPMKKLQSVAHKMLPTKVKTAKATALGAAMTAMNIPARKKSAAKRKA